MKRFYTFQRQLAHFEPPIFSSKENRANHNRLAWSLIEGLAAFLGSTTALAMLAASRECQITKAYLPQSSKSIPLLQKNMSESVSFQWKNQCLEGFAAGQRPSPKIMAKRRDSGLDLSGLCSAFHGVEVKAEEECFQQPDVDFVESLVPTDVEYSFAKAMQLYRCIDHSNADGVNQEIFDLLEYAAAHGHSHAAFNLAFLYEGKGMKHRALTLYKQAAHEGIGRAAFRIAFLLLEQVFGEEQKSLFEEAIHWLQMASSDGFLLASETLDLVDR